MPCNATAPRQAAGSQGTPGAVWCDHAAAGPAAKRAACQRRQAPKCRRQASGSRGKSERRQPLMPARHN
eukprot:2517226-Alexandrium_andersonii.AAC.1